MSAVGTRAILAVLAALLAAGCTRDDTAPSEAEAPGPPEPVPARTVSRSSAASNPEDWPPIEFEPATLDLGIVAPHETARGSFRIWNVGHRPLTILASRTSCSCTRADDLGGRVIKPGGSIECRLDLTPKGDTGEKNEMMRIRFADHDGIVEYRYGAEVSLPVRAVPPYLDAQATLEGSIVVESRDGTPFRILAAGSLPPVTADGTAPGDSRLRHELRWDLAPLMRGGRLPWYWVLETDHPETPVVDVRIRHETTRTPPAGGRRWVSDLRVLAGRVRDGEPFEVETRIEFPAGMRPALEGADVHSLSPFMTADLVEVVPDVPYLVYRVRIRTNGLIPGLLYGEIALRNGGFEAPIIVIGQVVP